MIFLIVIILFFIAYELNTANKLKTFEALNKKDDLLKNRYPNLYLNCREALIKYEDETNIIKQYTEEEYNKELIKVYKKVVKYPYLKTILLKNLFRDWKDVSSYIIRELENQKRENLGVLYELNNETYKFIKDVKEKTQITIDEINYILYSFWENILEHDAGLDDLIVNNEFIGEVFQIDKEKQKLETLENYKKIFLKYIESFPKK